MRLNHLFYWRPIIIFWHEGFSFCAWSGSNLLPCPWAWQLATLSPTLLNQLAFEIGGRALGFWRWLDDRVMFGTDQLLWPRLKAYSISIIQNATYLTTLQKRGILYNNAARFLRMDTAQGK